MIQRELLGHWLFAFALTECVECPLYVKLSRVRLGVAFAASAITHPVVVFVIPTLWSHAYVVALGAGAKPLSPLAYFIVYGVIAETFAIAVEASWLAWRGNLPWRRALVASLLANAASSSIGGLSYLAFGWP